MMCIVHCFERFIKFLNKNAYIQIAIEGTSFCTSARSAYYLIQRNGGRFLKLGSFGHVLQFLGKWTITLIATFSGYVLITRSDIYDEIHSPVFPTILAGFLSYFMSALVMSVFSTTCDSVMHCFFIDEEITGKDGNPPRFAPEVVLEFMNRERNPEKIDNRCCSC
mmetsp:Transcript_13559/g.2146  ORF Transcript_13559/g.2146 Transcript_13559/m.2146 type:complete len:165 (-) Transcript_13559:31-525(-)